MADAALGAMADDLERLLVGNRRAHHRFDVFGVSYFERIHASEGSKFRSESGEPNQPPDVPQVDSFFFQTWMSLALAGDDG